MITNEVIKGTPKLAVLETTFEDSNSIITLEGHSIECVENWGRGNIFSPGVYVERVSDNFNPEENKLVDLVNTRELRRSYPHILEVLLLHKRKE